MALLLLYLLVMEKVIRTEEYITEESKQCVHLSSLESSFSSKLDEIQIHVNPPLDARRKGGSST